MGKSSIFGLFVMIIIILQISAQQSSYNQSENSCDFQNSSINHKNRLYASGAYLLNICPQAGQQYIVNYYTAFTTFGNYINNILTILVQDLLMCVMITSILFFRSQHANSGKHLVIQALVQPDIITSDISTHTSYMGTKYNSIPYDVILQLNSVMAIIYTEQGNRWRRLGDLRTAKRCYQMAIRAHECNRQLFINIHSL